VEIDPVKVVTQCFVVTRDVYESLDEKQQAVAFVCEKALVPDGDNALGRMVPISEAPLHFCDMFDIDLTKLRDTIEKKPHLRVLKLFLTVFVDDFGIYSKIYHKTNGRYVGFGNLPYHLQILMRNIIAMTMAPPDTPPEEAVEAFLCGVREMEKGYEVDLGSELGTIFVMGALGVATTDCPQGNGDSGTLNANANYGCRCCLVPKEDLSKCDSDTFYTYTRRAKMAMEKVREEAKAEMAQSRKTEKLRAFGLKEAGPIYDSLAFDSCQQLPHDPFHLFVLGLITLNLSVFASALTITALNELNWLLKKSCPWFWGAVPGFALATSKSNRNKRKLKGCGENVRKQIQLLPAILGTWFDHTKIRGNWMAELKRVHHQTEEQVAVLVRRSVAAWAWAYRVVFSPTYAAGSDTILLIRVAVNQAKVAMKTCWQGVHGLTLDKVSNFHAADHAHEICEMFGSIRLCSCARGEAKHCFLRRFIANCNHRREEYDMLFAQNVIWAIKFLLSGGAKHIKHHYDQKGFLDIIETDHTLRELLRKKTHTDTYVGQQGAESHEVAASSFTTLACKHSGGPCTDPCNARLPNRESATSHVAVGEFFYCFIEGSLRVVLLARILVPAGINNVKHSALSTTKTAYVETDAVKVEVSPMTIAKVDLEDFGAEEKIDTVLTYGTDTTTVNISDITGPAHLYPVCEGALDGRSKCPVATASGTDCCFGISGLQGHNSPCLFIENKYFVK
jgi:hypothetical protein